MGEFSIMHLSLLFGIVLLFFGGRKLPELGGSMGRAIREFKDGINGKTEAAKIAEKAAEQKN